jgi:putative ABC transport system substrate-binding protein
MMRRREFITLIGGAAAAWPLAAPAQQGERVRRIGALYILPTDDREAQARHLVFQQTLQQLGWTVDRNLHIDLRLAGGNPADVMRYASELVALAPDAILAVGSATVAPLQRETRTIPIVFVNVADPVGAGLVESMSRPGGNTTGFTNFEYSMAGKWVELLKQIAPDLTRAAVLRDSKAAAGLGQFGAISAAAQSLGVELVPIGVGDLGEVERGVAAFARSPNGGLIVTTGGTGFRREAIIALALRHRLPAIYWERFLVAAGGLMSYGPDLVEQFRQAAGYVDRILKGEKPADLPVQAPTKYRLIINLKTAKSLGLTVPDALLARADEVIE